jgi:N-acetylmuramoyl-L-alanine amidase
VSTGLFGQCHVQRWWPLTVTLTVMMALAATAASVAQSPPSLLVEERIPLIVLDPGHGGTDQGAQGPTGLLEKDLTLQVATEAGRLIEELLGLRVVLTRTDDSVAPLETRAALANQAGGDLFISICTGGSLASGRRGFQVFYFDELQGGLPAVREQANNLQRPSPEEQRLRGEDGPPKPVLWDDAQLEFLETSQTFARMLHKNLRAQVGEEGRGVFGLPILLLRWVRTPAVLVDLGSLSDPAFADKLRDEAYLQRAALGIAQAVNDYQALQR